MKKLIPLFVLIAAGGIASAEWKLNPYTQRQDYYEAAGNSITSLTGAVTASGPGAAAATIVSVPQSAVNLSTVTAALSGKLDTNGSAASLTNFPTLNQNTTGNAATATALAADPTDCTGVNFARGINASGTAACAQPSDVTGNAATATKLLNSRTINGVSFDGSADINISATSYLADGVSLALTGATFSAKSSSVTLQGNTFNGASQLVKLDALSKLPAVDGSRLTNLPSTTGGAVLAATQTFTGSNTFTATGTGGTTISSATIASLTITQTTGANLVPPGAVMAFYLSACPSGWATTDGTNGTPDLRGMFVRGAFGDLNGTDPDANRVVGSTQTDTMQGHYHSSLSGGFANLTPGAVLGNISAAANYSNPTTGSPYTDGTNGTPRISVETRPKNVALLYCMKQ